MFDACLTGSHMDFPDDKAPYLLSGDMGLIVKFWAEL